MAGGGRDTLWWDSRWGYPPEKTHSDGEDLAVPQLCNELILADTREELVKINNLIGRWVHGMEDKIGPVKI